MRDLTGGSVDVHVHCVDIEAIMEAARVHGTPSYVVLVTERMEIP